jgi:hypothetical protein
MELANGVEEDGIRYRVFLAASCWVAEVTATNGKKLTEKWRWFFEPKCGPDLSDVQEAELVLDRLISSLRISPPV